MTISPSEYARRVRDRQASLYRMAFCYVKNRQDALDIVGEAVCRGLAGLDRLRDPARFDAWLSRILVNAALDHLRRQSAHPSDPDGDDRLSGLPAPEAGLTPEDSLDLYAALDSLEPEERTDIILRFFEDHSFRELSEILEQPESTIKSRLARTLQKLRKRLETRP